MKSTFPLEFGGRVAYMETSLRKVVYEEVIKGVLEGTIKTPIIYSNMHPSLVVSVIGPKV